MTPTVRHRVTTSVIAEPIQPGAAPGHRTRHVFHPDHWIEYDPFLLLAEDWFAPGTFGDHPHRGFETVTFVIDGELEHRDNHGGRGVLGLGDAQWMTAGRGIIHAEEPRGTTVHTLQLWLNLPAADKLIAPRYQDLRGVDMPVKRDNGTTRRVFAGALGALRAPTETHVPVTMVELRMEPGASAVMDLPARDTAFIYVIDGLGRFGGDERVGGAGQAVWFARSDSDGLSAVAVLAQEPFHAILWSGPPLGEPVVARGPFVMNTTRQIQDAYADYRAGRF
jgi:hypothetical protein